MRKQMMLAVSSRNRQILVADPEKREEMLEQLRTDGFVRDFETELKRPDGTLYYANLTTTRIALSGEDNLLTIVQDYTERKQAEEKLRRSLEATARGQRLLLALSQAAQTVQRARTPEEVYRAGERVEAGPEPEPREAEPELEPPQGGAGEEVKVP